MAHSATAVMLANVIRVAPAVRLRARGGSNEASPDELPSHRASVPDSPQSVAEEAVFDTGKPNPKPQRGSTQIGAPQAALAHILASPPPQLSAGALRSRNVPPAPSSVASSDTYVAMSELSSPEPLPSLADTRRPSQLNLSIGNSFYADFVIEQRQRNGGAMDHLDNSPPTAEEMATTLRKAKKFDKIRYVASHMKEKTVSGSNTYIGRKYPNTFKSKAAIEFLLTSGVANDENEAADVCTAMIRYGMIANAADSTFPEFITSGLSHWKQLLPPLYRWCDEARWSEAGLQNFLNSASEEAVAADSPSSGGRHFSLAHGKSDSDLSLDSSGSTANTHNNNNGAASNNNNNNHAATKISRAKNAASAWAHTAATAAASKFSALAHRLKGKDSDDKAQEDSSSSASSTIVASSGSQAPSVVGTTVTQEDSWPASRSSPVSISQENSYEPVDDFADTGLPASAPAAQKHFSGTRGMKRGASENAVHRRPDSAAGPSDRAPHYSLSASVNMNEVLAAAAARRAGGPLEPTGTTDSLDDDTGLAGEEDDGWSDSDGEEPASVILNDPIYEVVGRTSSMAANEMTEILMQTHQLQQQHHDSLSSITPTNSSEETPTPDRPAVVLMGGPQQLKLWSYREDVVAAGLVNTLSRKEIKRQETIYELLCSEESYAEQVKTLLKEFLMPMHVHSVSVNFNKTAAEQEPLVDLQVLNEIKIAAEAVSKCSKNVQDALKSRVEAALVVENIGDVFMTLLPLINRVYYNYSRAAVFAQDHFKERKEEIDKFFSQFKTEKSKGLPIDSYCIVPIQRMAKYPLLMKTLLEVTEPTHSDYPVIKQVYEEMESILHSCNEVIRIEESYIDLLHLDRQLVLDRLPDAHPVADRARKIVKIGCGKLLRVDERGKLVKARDVVLILLSDLFLYAKPKRSRKPPTTRYEVYDQFQRPFVVMTSHADIGDKKEGQNVLSIDIYCDPEGEPSNLLVHFNTAAERDAWLAAYSDKGTDQDTLYGVWDCPEVEIIADHYGTQPDELSVQVGQRFKVLDSRDDWTYGYNAAYAPNAKLNPSGWFPTHCAQRIESFHSQAKANKSNRNAAHLDYSSEI